MEPKHPVTPLTEDEVLAALRRVDDLPTLPAFARRLLDAVESAGSGAREVTEALRADQAVSMQVLRVANSAYYGLANRVATLERATMVLGFDEIRRIALSAAVMRAFPPIPGAPGFRVEHFWMHAIACAYAARFLAEAAGRRGAELDEAYTAGLLHDTGKLLAARHFGLHYGFIIHRCAADRRPPDQVEPELLGVDHATIGRWLATMWSLPASLVAAIGDHHAREPERAAPLARLVQAADALAHRARMGDGLGPPRPTPSRAAEALGLAESALREVAARLDAARSAVVGHLGESA